MPALVVTDGSAGGDIPQGDDAGLPREYGAHGQDGPSTPVSSQRNLQSRL